MNILTMNKKQIGRKQKDIKGRGRRSFLSTYSLTVNHIIEFEYNSTPAILFSSYSQSYTYSL